jgi:16S rRNA (cytosine1402-N4)-methyltransferase
MDCADVVLLDAGASRDQLVDPERGFSFTSDAHLDMRQSRAEPLTAHVVVNEYSLADLGAVLSRTGKAREARRIAARIVASRPINTTAQLAETIAAAVAKPWGARGKIRNPSAEWFMAIRVEVNDEVNELIGGIEAGVRALRPHVGRFLLLTWNGLEHHIARSSLRSVINPCRCPPTLPCVCGLKPLASWLLKGDSPTEAEIARNPSARSCRLFAVTAA